jgi:hypothetical protein
MGLPERFKLNRGSHKGKVRILGNGVCAPVMRKVVETLVRGEARMMAAE